MTEEILNKLIKKLEEERSLIVRAIETQEHIEKLTKVINEKQKLLELIKSLNPEELKKYKEKLEMIQKLSKVNMSLALDNLQFIEEVFSIVFNNETRKYDQSGSITQDSKNFFNKKI
ncbi:MAG: DUF1682 domain-containing protein [Aquificae bacterium]|nr:DUF1682 domain-containing protein [Aquificota bacterium]